MRTVVDPGRDVASIVLPRWGKVVPVHGVVPFAVVGDDGESVAAIGAFLRDFKASANRDGSVRSYAYDPLRWWRFLRGGRRRLGCGDADRGAGFRAVEQGWLGEVAAIQTTIAAADQKLVTMRNQMAERTTTNLGMPRIAPAVGRSSLDR